MTGIIFENLVKKSFVSGETQKLKRFPLTVTFLMGYLIVSLARIQELFPVLTVIHLGDITAGGSIICIIIEASSKGIGKISLLREEKYVLGILAIGIVTIPTSVWPSGCIKFITGPYLRVLVLFFLVTMAIRTVPDLRKMVWAFLVGTFLIALMSVKNQLTHFGGITATYDANDIALIMVCALPFTICFFKQTKFLGKIFISSSILLGLQTIILSASRGGFLGLIVIGGYLIIKAKKKRGLMIVGCVVGAILLSQIAPSSYWERISGIWDPQNEYDASGGGRLDLWKLGFNIFIHNIFTGVGINNYFVADGLAHIDVGGKWTTAHNSFIQIGVELGVVGLILFILLTFGTVLKMRKVQKVWQGKSEYREMMWLVSAVEVSMCGYIACGFFLSAAYFYNFYFILGLSVAIQRIAMRIAVNKEKDVLIREQGEPNLLPM